MGISRWFGLVAFTAVAVAAVSAQGLPPLAPAPAENPVTTPKANLGKALFWDEQLSFNRTVSCGTCHMPEGGGADPRTASRRESVHPGADHVFGTEDDVRGSLGIHRVLGDGSYGPSPHSHRLIPQVTPRRAPSVINSGFSGRYFWDGRAQGAFRDPFTNAVVIAQGAALEEQALAPPKCDVEMGQFGGDWNPVVARIEASPPLRIASEVPAALASWIGSRSYPELYEEAFGSPGVSAVRTAMAIATYERTLVSNQAPFDDLLNGASGVLTPLENQGRLIFNGIARCDTCHTGPRLTDDAFHYTGVRPADEDVGRFSVTHKLADLGRMRTPSLRNVELRAPYFHNGGKATLREVIEFYDRGGDFHASNQAASVAPIGLSEQQKDALIAFLSRPLTDPRLVSKAPPFDRPSLYSESARAPVQYGDPTAGTGGFEPQIVAIEPPAVGLPTWTIAVDRGHAGKPGVLVLSPAASFGGVPFQGATLHVGLVRGAQVIQAGALQGSGSGDGWASAQITLPGDPQYIGNQLYVQWFVLDPQGPGRRLAASAAAELTLF